MCKKRDARDAGTHKVARSSNGTTVGATKESLLLKIAGRIIQRAEAKGKMKDIERKKISGNEEGKKKKKIDGRRR